MNTMRRYQIQGWLILLGLTGLMLLTACHSNAGTGSEGGNISASEDHAGIKNTEDYLK